MTDRELETIEKEARELLAFADGVEASSDVASSPIERDQDGRVVYARLARRTARETIRLVAALRTERSARTAIQAERDRLLGLLMERAA